MRVPIVIVGNKSDLVAERVVDSSELVALTEDLTPNSTVGVETSAKKNVSVDEVQLVTIS